MKKYMVNLHIIYYMCVYTHSCTHMHKHTHVHTETPPDFILRYFIMTNLFETKNQTANEFWEKNEKVSFTYQTTTQFN